MRVTEKNNNWRQQNHYSFAKKKNKQTKHDQFVKQGRTGKKNIENINSQGVDLKGQFQKDTEKQVVRRKQNTRGTFSRANFN